MAVQDGRRERKYGLELEMTGEYMANINIKLFYAEVDKLKKLSETSRAKCTAVTAVLPFFAHPSI